MLLKVIYVISFLLVGGVFSVIIVQDFRPRRLIGHDKTFITCYPAKVSPITNNGSEDQWIEIPNEFGFVPDDPQDNFGAIYDDETGSDFSEIANGLRPISATEADLHFWPSNFTDKNSLSILQRDKLNKICPSHSFKIQPVYLNEGGIVTCFIYLTILFTVLYVLFESVRRLFYYIMVGSFFPKSRAS